jgi:cobalamin biosynthesis Mg chelatase CobN
VASTSVVNYGTSSYLGLTAQTPGLTTNHNVALSAPNIVKGATYYFTVTSATANGASNSSDSQQFNTPGFDVTIVVQNKQGKTLKDANVTINGKSLKTNAQGQAVFSDIAAGNQQVSIKVGSKVTNQTIQIGKLDPTTNTYQPQTFKLTAAAPSNSSLVDIIVGLIVVLLLLGIALRNKLMPPKGGGSAGNVINSDSGSNVSSTVGGSGGAIFNPNH